jgi:20S proteasome alpha/beta subunit
MTLLVGILCRDGVVMASDRQVSHGAMGVRTVGAPGTKFHILDEPEGRSSRTLFGTSGVVGLGQQYEEVLKANRANMRDQGYAKIVPTLQLELRRHMAAAAAAAQSMVPLVGHPAAQEAAFCGALLATSFSDGLKLVEISPSGTFEYLSPDVPFVCMGAGKQNADPLVRFFWSILWPKQLPTVQEGILAAHLTITTVTQLGTAGVGMGLDVFVIEAEPDAKGKQSYVARRISEEKVAEHESFAESIREAIKGVRDKLAEVAPPQDGEAAGPPELEPK